MDRPEARNAVDGPAARALAEAFREFEHDDRLRVAVLWGAGGTFCAGADLKRAAPSAGSDSRRTAMAPWDRAAWLHQADHRRRRGLRGAGGLELALMCDLRVARRRRSSASSAGGGACRSSTAAPIRLPRLIGLSRALDMILTGRPVDAHEALAFGLANRVVAAGRAREEAESLAQNIAAFPPHCVQSDRRSAWEGTDLSLAEALANEFSLGKATHDTGESQEGARRFAEGAGRHGRF
jgi:Enoyl-CoA hydratase/carnithine racemase